MNHNAEWLLCCSPEHVFVLKPTPEDVTWLNDNRNRGKSSELFRWKRQGEWWIEDRRDDAYNWTAALCHRLAPSDALCIGAPGPVLQSDCNLSVDGSQASLH